MLNSTIVNSHLNALGLSGNRVTIQEIKTRYKQIAEIYHPDTCDTEQFKKIQAAYQFLTTKYVPVKDYVNNIPVYEVSLKLSDIYCNREYSINDVRFVANSSCLKPLCNYQTCILLYKVQSDYNFKYNNLDLLYTLDVSMLDLLIGTEVNIKLLDNSFLTITVPSKSSPNDIITIPNTGLANTNSIGNLYIKLNPVVPAVSDQFIGDLKQFIRINLR